MFNARGIDRVSMKMRDLQITKPKPFSVRFNPIQQAESIFTQE